MEKNVVRISKVGENKIDCRVRVDIILGFLEAQKDINSSPSIIEFFDKAIAQLGIDISENEKSLLLKDLSYRSKIIRTLVKMKVFYRKESQK